MTDIIMLSKIAKLMGFPFIARRLSLKVDLVRSLMIRFVPLSVTLCPGRKLSWARHRLSQYMIGF